MNSARVFPAENAISFLSPLNATMGFRPWPETSERKIPEAKSAKMSLFTKQIVPFRERDSRFNFLYRSSRRATEKKKYAYLQTTFKVRQARRLLLCLLGPFAEGFDFGSTQLSRRIRGKVQKWKGGEGCVEFVPSLICSAFDGI